MLRNKSNNGSRTQNQKYNYASGNPSNNNYWFGPELVFVSQFFPVTSDYIGGNATVATGQISGSHQSLSDEATFRKVFRLALFGKEASISGWGWSSPSTNDATFRFQSQRILGIYTPYGTPVQSNHPKNVVNYYFRLGNSDAWVPEQQPGKEAKPNVYPDFCKNNADRFGGKRNSSSYRKGNSQNRHDFAGAGSKQLGIHTVSFTQSAAEAGAAK
jgi:hypothetical protein